jgi:HemY protein
MLMILWFLFVAFVIATSLVWLLDHNGDVIITWLGYQLQTDVLTAILLAIFFTLLVFAFSYLLARILAIKFPNLLKLFFRRNYLRRLEKLVHRHHQAFEIMTQLMLALEIRDEKSAEILHKNFSKLIKHQSLNNFFLGKILFEKQQFDKAAEMFARFGENKHAKILILKSKFKLALQNQDEATAIAYAKQILSVKRDNFDTARVLFSLYKKRGLWQEAKGLIAEYGSDQFKDELQKRDVAVINSALAIEAYQLKKFLQAIKHTKIALKAEENFLPALEIKLKSWLKLGFSFKASWQIKSLWRENPHLLLAEIFDLIHRKSSPKNRIKAMKKLAELNSESSLGKLAVGISAFRAGAYQTAKEFLYLSLLQEKTYRAYKLLAFAEKSLGNVEEFKKNMKKSEMLSKDDHYSCNSCGHLTSKWSARCASCDSYDSLEWNS